MSSPTTTLITSCAGSAITARTGPTLSWPRSSPLAVREEIRSLPTELKSLVPTFQNVFEFADYPELRRGPLPGSIDGVLLSAVELAAFINYYENNPNGYSVDLAGSYLAGLGIGLLATAAVSLSRNLADLPVAGAEVVRTAFRLSVLVDYVSQDLQPRELTESDTPDPWAYVILDVTPEKVQRELDDIHAKVYPCRARSLDEQWPPFLRAQCRDPA